jgi:hypothetical protein
LKAPPPGCAQSGEDFSQNDPCEDISNLTLYPFLSFPLRVGMPVKAAKRNQLSSPYASNYASNPNVDLFAMEWPASFPPPAHSRRSTTGGASSHSVTGLPFHLLASETKHSIDDYINMFESMVGPETLRNSSLLSPQPFFSLESVSNPLLVPNQPIFLDTLKCDSCVCVATAVADVRLLRQGPGGVPQFCQPEVRAGGKTLLAEKGISSRCEWCLEDRKHSPSAVSYPIR